MHGKEGKRKVDIKQQLELRATEEEEEAVSHRGRNGGGGSVLLRGRRRVGGKRGPSPSSQGCARNPQNEDKAAEEESVS